MPGPDGGHGVHLCGSRCFKSWKQRVWRCCWRIIDAILEGQRDPKELVKLRDWRVRKSTVAEMEAAPQGDWREELLLCCA